MRNDSTNIFALVAGFISGSIICNYFNTAVLPPVKQVRAYAAEELANCDKPKPWNPKELKRYSLMLPEARRKYLIDREKEFKRLCKEAAREINQEALEQADPEQTNLKYNVFPNADEDPDAKILFPVRPDKLISSDVNKAAYAHAYKVTIA